MKKLICLLFVLAFNYSSAALAADYTISICAIQPEDYRDTGFVDPCGSWTSQSNCPSGGWITWDMSSKQGYVCHSFNGLFTGERYQGAANSRFLFV